MKIPYISLESEALVEHVGDRGTYRGGDESAVAEELEGKDDGSYGDVEHRGQEG